MDIIYSYKRILYNKKELTPGFWNMARLSVTYANQFYNTKLYCDSDTRLLFEEKNIERVAKGLPPLKHLPVLKKKVENVIEQQNQPIPQYVPEENEGCHAILKSGPNKGKQCGCKKLEANGLCKRHNQKDPEIKVEKAEKNDL